MARRYTFAEFGEQFVSRAVMPQLAATVSRSLPREIHVEKEVPNAKVVGVVMPRGATGRRISPDEVLVSLSMHMTLHVLLLGFADETYEIEATVQFPFRVETWEPLVVFVNVLREVPESAVSLSISSSAWLKLAQKVGNLEGEVRKAIAQELTKQLAATKNARTIDVLKLAGGGAKGGPAQESVPEAERASILALFERAPARVEEPDLENAQGLLGEGPSAPTGGEGAPKSWGTAGGAAPPSAPLVAPDERLEHVFDGPGTAFFRLTMKKGQHVSCEYFAQGAEARLEAALREAWGGGLDQAGVSADAALGSFDWTRGSLNLGYLRPVEEDGEYLFSLTASAPVVFRTKGLKLEER